MRQRPACRHILGTGLAADPAGGLDPEAVENNTCGFTLPAIYDSPVRDKPGTADVEPGLAGRRDITSGALRYGFHLRPRAMLHDGTKLNAKTLDQTSRGSSTRQARSRS